MAATQLFWIACIRYTNIIHYPLPKNLFVVDTIDSYIREFIIYPCMLIRPGWYLQKVSLWMLLKLYIGNRCTQTLLQKSKLCFHGSFYKFIGVLILGFRILKKVIYYKKSLLVKTLIKITLTQTYFWTHYLPVHVVSL